MLLHELVQGGNGVQLPGNHLFALGVQAPGGDPAVLVQNQLVGKAVFQHVGVVVGVVVGQDQGLLPLGEIEGVADHDGGSVLARRLAPHAADVHQYVIVGVAAVQNLVELVHRHHIVVQALLLGVAVKGQLRVGDEGVENQVLHDAVPGRVGHAVPAPALGHDGGVQNFIGLGLGFGFRFRLRFRVGFGVLRRGRLRRGRGVLDGGLVRFGLVLVLSAAGGGQQQRQRQQQRGEFLHSYPYLLWAAGPPCSASLVYHGADRKQATICIILVTKG